MLISFRLIDDFIVLIDRIFLNARCKARLGLSQQISRRQDVAGNKLLSNEVAAGLKDLLRCELFPIDDGMDSCTTKPCILPIFLAHFKLKALDFLKMRLIITPFFSLSCIICNFNNADVNSYELRHGGRS